MMEPYRYLTIPRTRISNRFRDQYSKFKRLRLLKVKIAPQIWTIPMITLKRLYMSTQLLSQQLRKTLRSLRFSHQAVKIQRSSFGILREKMMRWNSSLRSASLNFSSQVVARLIRDMSPLSNGTMRTLFHSL